MMVVFKLHLLYWFGTRHVEIRLTQPIKVIIKKHLLQHLTCCFLFTLIFHFNQSENRTRTLRAKTTIFGYFFLWFLSLNVEIKADEMEERWDDRKTEEACQWCQKNTE